jgi:hypothetical protein
MEKTYECMKQDKKESYVNYIVQEMDTELKNIKPSYFSVILVPDFYDTRPFQWLNYRIKINYTYSIDVRNDLKDIWGGFTSVCKQNIRKGEELKCHTARCDDTSVLTGLLTDRYNEQGMNLKLNPAFLKEAITAYPDNLPLIGLYDGKQIIGATLNQVYNRYIGWMGLTKPKDSKYVNVNEYMLWQLIQQAKEAGVRKFEISGANKQSLCRYRSKFNPQLETYYIISKENAFGKIAESIYFRFIKNKFR